MKRLFTAIVASFFLHPVFGFENMDECGELKKQIKAQQFDLELDVLPILSREYLGFEVDYNDGEPFITKVHPDITFLNNQESQEEDEKLEASDLEFAGISHVDGVEVANLSEEDFLSVFTFSAPETYNGKGEDVIKITLADNNKTYHVKFAEYETFDVYISPDIEHISSIDSKDGSFKTKLKLHTVWHDYRLSEMASLINQKGYKGTDLSVNGFYCRIKPSFFREIDYPIPQVLLPTFVAGNSKNERERKIRIDYFPPEDCTDLDCIDQEKEFGSVQLSVVKEFQGKVFTPYDLRQFPFDTQQLEFEFLMDTEDFYNTDLRMSEVGKDFLWKSWNNFDDPEWTVTDYDYDIGHYYDAAWDVRPTYLWANFEYERKTQYYIFKIMFPVLFLVFISWSVFWLHPKQLESRVTVSVICLLSLIAYNFVIDQELPKLGYMTFLDGFIFISYIFAGFPTLQTIFCRRLYDSNRAELSISLDRYCQKLLPVFFAGLLLVLTVIYGF